MKTIVKDDIRQLVWPRRHRIFLRWKFDEWLLLPRLVVTRYHWANESAVCRARRSVIVRWLFIIADYEVDARPSALKS
jgi:hypothetical protein